MKMFKVMMLAVIVGGIFLSCQKTENYDQIGLLVDKDWRLVSITENGLEVGDNCQLDNSMRFTTDGELTHNSGAVDCEDEFQPQKWNFVRDYTQIKLKTKINNGLAVQKQELLELSENRLVLKEHWPDDSQDMPRLFIYSSE